MPEYVVTLNEEDDATLAYQTETVNLIRASHSSLPGIPLPPLTVTEVLQTYIARALGSTRGRLDTAARPVEAMLLPLTPAQRVALIDRIPSAAVRQRIIDLLRNR